MIRSFQLHLYMKEEKKHFINYQIEQQWLVLGQLFYIRINIYLIMPVNSVPAFPCQSQSSFILWYFIETQLYAFLLFLHILLILLFYLLELPMNSKKELHFQRNSNISYKSTEIFCFSILCFFHFYCNLVCYFNCFFSTFCKFICHFCLLS